MSVIARYAIICSQCRPVPRHAGEPRLGAYYAHKKFRFAQKESTPVSRLARDHDRSLPRRSEFLSRSLILFCFLSFLSPFLSFFVSLSLSPFFSLLSLSLFFREHGGLNNRLRFYRHYYVLSGKWLEDSFARGTRAAADRLELLLLLNKCILCTKRIQGVPENTQYP